MTDPNTPAPSRDGGAPDAMTEVIERALVAAIDARGGKPIDGKSQGGLRWLASSVATEVARRQGVTICSGCGTSRTDAVIAVLEGKMACCPDCSTLSLDERNQIRAAQHAARSPASVSGVAVTEEMIETGLREWEAETSAVLGPDNDFDSEMKERLRFVRRQTVKHILQAALSAPRGEAMPEAVIRDDLPTRTTPNEGTREVCPTCHGDGKFVEFDKSCAARWAHRFLNGFAGSVAPRGTPGGEPNQIERKRMQMPVLDALRHWRGWWPTEFSDDLILTGKQANELCEMLVDTPARSPEPEATNG